MEPVAPAQIGPAVISVPSATWSALLSAVATALKAPQQLQSQLGRQILGPVRLELPPEQPQAEISDDHSSKVMDTNIINGDPPAAVMPAQQSVGPAVDVFVEHLPAKEAARARIDSRAASGLLEAAKAEPQQEQGSQKNEKGGDDAGKAAPARASRRLEARR